MKHQLSPKQLPNIAATRRQVVAAGVIEYRENVLSASIAAMRRNDVAMGVSPWNTNDSTRVSPEGTKGGPRRARSFAPSGLSIQKTTSFHGLAPMATAFRPFGTVYAITMSNRGGEV